MKINTITVLGANGTMGSNVAGIFASFGNAKVYMVARSMQDAKNAKKKAANSVRAEAINKNLIPKTYDDIEECITNSDLVFESVAENLETKCRVYQQIEQFLQPGTIIGTGTSGLSINELSKNFDSEQRKRFLGIHMFNPPYNMSLCEVIPSDDTDQSVLKEIKSYLQNTLLRDVVEVKDAPAFMGNRIGFQFINESLQYAEKYKHKGGIDYIDAIFGGVTGRSMPPLVTSDFVGLDVHKAIVDNIYENTHDYEHATFVMPAFAQQLIAENKLGRKTGEGLYRKVEAKDGRKTLEVYDINSGNYRPVKNYRFKFIEDMKNHLKVGKYSEAFRCLVNDTSEEALICIQLLIKYTAYSLHVSNAIGENIHSSDHVMATGFNWIPPLALLEALAEVRLPNSILKEKMTEKYIDSLDEAILNTRFEKSIYDYRSFLKAK